MQMPDTFFKSVLSDGPCVIDYPLIFNAGKNSEDGHIDFFGCRLGLAQKAAIPRLESEYLARLRVQTPLIQALRQKPVDVDDSSPHLHAAMLVMQLSCCPRMGVIAEHLLPQKELFFFQSLVYPLFSSIRGDVSVKGRRFHLGLSHIASAHEIEANYKARIAGAAGKNIESMALGCLAKGSFYNSEKQLGFKIIDSRFYVFTKIPPFILYERNNGAYYKFWEAEIGAPVFMKSSSFDFGRLYVLNPYTHPSLPAADKPMQCICTGKYDYSSIKRMHPDNPMLQLEALIEKARAVLSEEYRSNGKPYAFLTDKRFDSQKLTGYVDKSRVTNME